MGPCTARPLGREEGVQHIPATFWNSLHAHLLHDRAHPAVSWGCKNCFLPQSINPYPDNNPAAGSSLELHSTAQEGDNGPQTHQTHCLLQLDDRCAKRTNLPSMAWKKNQSHRQALPICRGAPVPSSDAWGSLSPLDFSFFLVAGPQMLRKCHSQSMSKGPLQRVWDKA